VELAASTFRIQALQSSWNVPNGEWTAGSLKMEAGSSSKKSVTSKQTNKQTNKHYRVPEVFNRHRHLCDKFRVELLFTRTHNVNFVINALGNKCTIYARYH
jgi:hypothetical protein